MTAVEWSEVVRNWAIVAAGGGGFGIALWRAVAADRQSRAQREQADLARREHVAAIFSQAVASLEHDALHMRLGAIYSLREVIRSDPDLAAPARDVLALYLREVDYGDGEPPLDVVEIMKIVIGTKS